MSDRNQRQRVLGMLQRSATGVCGTTFTNEHILRYSARFTELRKQGYVIDRVPCQDAWHGYRTRQWRYVLEQPGQMELG